MIRLRKSLAIAQLMAYCTRVLEMTQQSGPSPSDEIADGYRSETRKLLARRLRTAVVVFLVVATIVASLELIFFPGRWRALLAVHTVYLVVSVGAYLTVRRLPA